MHFCDIIPTCNGIFFLTTIRLFHSKRCCLIRRHRQTNNMKVLIIRHKMTESFMFSFCFMEYQFFFQFNFVVLSALDPETVRQKNVRYYFRLNEKTYRNECNLQ